MKVWFSLLRPNPFIVFLVLGLIFFNSAPSFSQSTEDELLRKISNTQDKNEIASLFNDLSVELQYQETIKAIDYAQKSISYAREAGNWDIYFEASANLATAYCYAGNYVNANDTAKRGLNEAHDRNSTSGKILMLENLGRCAKAINDYETALEYYNQALELTISQENTDPSILIIVYGNMAGLYVLMDQYETALVYYLKIFELIEEDDKHNLMVAHVNLAYNYLKIEDFSNSEKHANDLLALTNEVNSNQFRGYGYNMLGELNAARFEKFNNGEFLLNAERYFKAAIDFIGELDKNSLYASTGLNFAKVLYSLKKYDASIALLEEILDIAQTLNVRETVVETHFYLAENHLNNGNPVKASDHLHQFKTLNEELYSESLSEKISSMLVQFDTNTKEHDLNTTRLENEVLKKDAEITLYLGLFGFLLFFFILSIVYLFSRNKSKQLEIFEKLSRTDSLTGLKNRRAIEEIFDREWERFHRSGVEFTTAVGDIDNFKLINDEYGHTCGDFVLKKVSQIMENTIRKNDEIARWGGEEFIFLFVDSTLEKAKWVTEKIRAAVEAETIHFEGKRINVTMSFGVSQIEQDKTIYMCIKEADEAMLEAKKQGRNRMVAA